MVAATERSRLSPSHTSRPVTLPSLVLIAAPRASVDSIFSLTGTHRMHTQPRADYLPQKDDSLSCHGSSDRRYLVILMKDSYDAVCRFHGGQKDIIQTVRSKHRLDDSASESPRAGFNNNTCMDYLRQISILRGYHLLRYCTALVPYSVHHFIYPKATFNNEHVMV